jgi:UDP-N-acetylmuramoylalanine--D-glutamate ligase
VNANRLAGKRVLIWGAARSGLAAVSLVQPLAAKIALADDSPREDIVARIPKALQSIALFAGADSVSHSVGDWDLVIISPGVPADHPQIVAAKRAGVPVLSELEVGSWFIQGRLVAITGTNGKTTTATLAAHLLGGEARGTYLAGNVGQALCEVMQRAGAQNRSATIVAEVSSFQCEHLDSFHPQIAVVLNLRPDHLDRHGDLATYRACKAAMGKNLTDDDLVIVNGDDDEALNVVAGWRGHRWSVSLDSRAETGVHFDGEAVTLTEGGEQEVLFRSADLVLPGRHNLANAMTAAAIARRCGVDPSDIASRCSTFRGVPHRIEWIATAGGVTYHNDSKSTNMDALATALTSFPQVVLIAGGRSKGEDLAPITKIICRHVRALVLLGETAEALERAWGKAVSITEQATDIADAVKRAHRLAQPGDCVLLSPGHPSFDMFRNFEDRGDQFRAAVLALLGPQEVHA